MKALHNWPLMTGDRVDSPYKEPVMRKGIPCHASRGKKASTTRWVEQVILIYRVQNPLT